MSFLSLYSIISLSLISEQSLFKIKKKSKEDKTEKYFIIFIFPNEQLEEEIKQTISPITFKKNSFLFFIHDKRAKCIHVKVILKAKEIMNELISNNNQLNDTNLYFNLFADYDFIKSNTSLHKINLKHSYNNKPFKEDDFAFVELIVIFIFILCIIIIVLFIIEK